MKHELIVKPDEHAIATEAAAKIAGVITECVRARGRCDIALSGGSTPQLMFARLVEHDLPWAKVRVYQVDERIAPAGSDARNLTEQHMYLGTVSVDEITMPVNDTDLGAAAKAYAALLPERFDLIHLGLGANGHTASLIPGDPVLDVTDQLVALSEPFQKYRRMTLTYPALARADKLLWLVAGAKKADVVAQLFDGDRSIPAGRVEAASSVIFADADAASKLVVSAVRSTSSQEQA